MAALFLALLAALPASAAPAAKQQVLALRPTQFAVGIVEVASRRRLLEGMGKRELKKYLADRPIPVVLGPDARLYMVDHHHLSRAAWELGIPKLPVTVIADRSGLSEGEFWDEMRRAKHVYPYDQFGNPRDPALLPSDVRGLADDPYRSLSWKVRDLGGYDKTPQPYAEFQWAEFFRRNLSGIGSVNDEFDAAVEKALALARSPAAAGLPGYRGGREAVAPSASSR